MPLAVALALAPALAAWWTGRSVLAHADDPALPELLLERRKRLAGFTVAGIVTLTLLFADDALWTVPLLWIALLLSARPLRRLLFGERLGTLPYLRYALSSAIGQAGVWLLAATTPALAIYFALGVAPNDHDAAVRAAAWVGGAFAIVVGLWQYNYARVHLALHHASPLRASASPALMARLDAVIERASRSLLKRPEIYRYGAPGAYVMNALAIPSRSYPAVALGDTLLTTLSEDEIVAVFAHEIAHHEQFTARWRFTRLRLLLLVILIGGLPPLLVDSLPSLALAIGWCVPLLLAVSLGRRVAKRRESETASDLRAVTLTDGNAEALVSALTKVYFYNRVPRRWPHATERGATHPSLARRIQALRAAVNAVEHPEAQVAAPLAAFRSTNAGLVVAFARDRAYWFEGVPADTPLELHALRDAASSYRAIAYADLTELNLNVSDGDRVVGATDREGRTWLAPIAPDNVSAVQAALDRIDVKLGQRRPAATPAGATTVRWLALALLIVLSAAGQLGVTLLPITLLLVRPTLTSAIAATAAFAIARVLLALPVLAWTDPLRQIALLLSVGITIALIVQAGRRARAESSRGNTRRLTREGLLVAGGLAAIAVLVSASLWPLIADRPSSLVSHPAAILIATLLFAASGSLLSIPSRWWRIGGALLSVAMLAAGAVLNGDGWLIRRTRPLLWSARRLTAHGAVRLAGGGLTITASPNGGAFAVSQYQPIRRGQVVGGTRYLIGRFADTASAIRPTTAASVAFLDDDRVIVLDSAAGDSLEVRAERVEPNANGGATMLWRERLPPVDAPQLLLDRARHAWLVVARGEGDRSFVVASDTIGGTTPRIIHLGSASPDDIGEVMTQPLAAFADGSAIWSTLPGLRGPEAFPTTLLLAMAASPRWEIRGSDSSGERFLADVSGFLACGSEVGERGALCVDRSANGTNLWRAASARVLTRVASLPPIFDLVHSEGTDAMAAAERFGQRAAVVDVASRRAYRLTLPGESAARAGMRWTADVVARGGYLIVLSATRDGATVTRYSIR